MDGEHDAGQDGGDQRLADEVDSLPAVSLQYIHAHDHAYEEAVTNELGRLVCAEGWVFDILIHFGENPSRVHAEGVDTGQLQEQADGGAHDGGSEVERAEFQVLMCKVCE